VIHLLGACIKREWALTHLLPGRCKLGSSEIVAVYDLAPSLLQGLQQFLLSTAGFLWRSMY